MLVTKPLVSLGMVIFSGYQNGYHMGTKIYRITTNHIEIQSFWQHNNTLILSNKK